MTKKIFFLCYSISESLPFLICINLIGQSLKRHVIKMFGSRVIETINMLLKVVVMSDGPDHEKCLIFKELGNICMLHLGVTITEELFWLPFCLS